METVWLDITLWIQSNALWIVLIGVMAMLAAVSNPLSYGKVDLGWLNFRPKNYQRGRKMLQKQRQDYVFNLLTYDFTDRIENRVYHGEISREEAKELYRRLKQVFPKVRDIFPSSEYLKEKIKDRLGKHTAPNFPDKKVVKKMKHMFDRVERVTL